MQDVIDFKKYMDEKFTQMPEFKANFEKTYTEVMRKYEIKVIRQMQVMYCKGRIAVLKGRDKNKCS